jgi:hypothetical protein
MSGWPHRHSGQRVGFLVFVFDPWMSFLVLKLDGAAGARLLRGWAVFGWSLRVDPIVYPGDVT